MFDKVYKVEFIPLPGAAEKLKQALESRELQAAHLESIPISCIQDFIDGNRSNIWVVKMGDEPVIEVKAERETAEEMLEMCRAVEKKEFAVADLLLDNVSAFLDGTRSNLIELSIRRVDRKLDG